MFRKEIILILLLIPLIWTQESTLEGYKIFPSVIRKVWDYRQSAYFDQFLGIPSDFYVNTSKCVIPKIEPENSPVTKYFTQMTPLSCGLHPPLTEIIYNVDNTVATLKLFTSRMKLYLPPRDRDAVVKCRYEGLTINNHSHKLMVNIIAIA